MIFISGTEQLGIFFYSNCKETNADCSYWDYLCVCHCNPGYFMYYGHCIQGKIKSFLNSFFQLLAFLAKYVE